MTALFFLYGLIFGSFYNVIIYRIPRGLSFVQGRSVCPSCGEALRVSELVPIVSYLAQRGKCRRCSRRISPCYPIIELMSGIGFVLAYERYGFSFDTFLWIFFWSMLLVVAEMDRQEKMIHDGVLLVFALLELLMSFLIGRELREMLWGALAGYTIYLPIYWGARLFYRREAFGRGDVHFLTVIGLVLGKEKTIATGILAFYIALLFILALKFFGKKWSREEELPFAPMIATAAFILSLRGDEMLRWITKAFGF